MGLCQYVDLCFHASSLPCSHTFWHAIPTSFYIFNVFKSCWYWFAYKRKIKLFFFGIVMWDWTRHWKFEMSELWRNIQQYSKEFSLSQQLRSRTFHFTFDVWRFPIHKFSNEYLYWYWFAYKHIFFFTCTDVGLNPKIEDFNVSVVLWPFSFDV